MTEIQQARDAFAKWRTGPATKVITQGRTLIPLVDGTAGNPELLDAIDELLALEAAVAERGGPVLANTKRIAAAIITANERMSA